MKPNRLTFSVLMATGLASGAGMAASPSSFTEKPFTLDQIEVTHSSKQVTNTPQQKRYLVQLESPAVANYQGQLHGLVAAKRTDSGKLQMTATESQSYAGHLQQQQKSFISELNEALPAAKVEKQLSLTFNGVVISGLAEQEALAAIPGVKAVYPEKLFHATMDSSLTQINASSAWERLEGRDLAGTGVRVAVIDSGIRPENPMFSDEGFTAPATLPTDDYCHTTDPGFCNNKLIVARWMQPTFQVNANEHMSPLGYNGHGTHVAGTSVGNPVSVTFDDIDMDLSGVAPGAYLMVYKALFYREDGASGSNIMLMEALEAAVADGADIINNSWGGGPGEDPAFSPYKEAFEAAEAAGVVVVSAAGNDGNGDKTIGCPGCIESGITVANLQTGRMFSNALSINGLGEYGSLESNSSAQLADLAGPLAAPLAAAPLIDEENYTGCEPFPADSFAGQIAMISRGGCTFSSKAANAQAAGAVGLVVYNSRPGYLSMYMPDATLPAIMISQADGEAIVAELENGALTASIDNKRSAYVAPELVDVMNGSSSRGPNGNAAVLKPDLAAPGTQILSAASPELDGGDFGLKTGTSMASPHVAGAAALLRALHPEWTPLDIKAALTSTANQTVMDDDIVTPATPFDMGAGRIDLALAGDAALSFDTVSIASPVCVGSCVFERSMKSLSDASINWQASINFESDGIEASLSTSSIELATEEEASFTISINTDYAEKDVWHFGTLTWEDSTGNAPAAHMAIAIYAGSSDAPGVLITSSAELTSDKAVPAFTQLTNADIKDNVTLVLTLPEGLKFADKPALSINRATQLGYEADQETGIITWVGELGLPEMALSTAEGIEFSLTEFDGALSLCEGEASCDDALFGINVPTVTFAGKQYGKILVSTNGYIELADSSNGNPRGKQLPNSNLSNAIVAPFLTDLDLTETVSDASLLLNVLGDGTNDFLIVEWNKAPLWNDVEGKTYSFQVWFNLTTGAVDYNYLDLGTMPSRDVTVGIQDAGGTVGATSYFNGEGKAPTSDSSLEADIQLGGQVNFAYDLKANAIELDPQTASTDEESPLTLDLSNTKGSALNVVNAVLRSRGKPDVHAQSLVTVGSASGISDIEILDAPLHGTLETNDDGTLVYTPEQDYFGKDSFTFSATENGSGVTTKGSVSLEVANVNDAPQLAVTGQTSNNTSARFTDTNKELSVEGKSEVTLSAAETLDADGDELTYQWEQLSGPTVEFDNSAASISFTAPNEDVSLEFQVTVSDGSESVTSPAEKVNVSRVSGGGSAFGFALLLLPLALFRRRVR